MKKQLILGGFLAFAAVVNAQKWDTYGEPIYSSSQYLGTSTSFDLRIGTAGTEKMRVATSGNVGIGSTAPGCRLQVIDNSGNTPEINLNSTTTNLTRFSLSSPNRTYWMSNDNTTAHLGYMISTTYVNLINWNDQGRVGINVANPTEQFHTNGGVRFEGLTSGGTNVVTIDGTGKLHIGAAGTGAGGVTSACSTANNVPRFNSSGNLICSQIDDDGINTVSIGSPSGCSYTYPGGYGWTTGTTLPSSTGNARLCVNGVTKALGYFSTSDMRFKKNIQPIKNALKIINNLEGKTYLWRTEEFKDKDFTTASQVGFIAQDVEKFVPEAVITNSDGYKSVNYDMIIPILVEAVKDQQKQIEELKTMVVALTGKNEKAGTSTGVSVQLNDKNSIVLNQNVPNPFAESTVISYNIPTDFTRAQINFTTSDGKIIKSVNITEKGANTLNVFGNDLSSGIYTYSLVVDGKTIDTKKMVKE